MPTYDYECPQCGASFDRVLPISQYNDPQTCECGTVATKIISPTNFILKGDDWAGKAIKIKNQMAEKNRRLATRQEALKRDAPPATLVPNVNGERVDSWSEAQKLASSKGLNAESYAPKVQEEQSKR